MSRLGSFAAGLGTSALGFVLLRNGLWDRAEHVADALGGIHDEVPNMNRPEQVRAVLAPPPCTNSPFACRRPSSRTPLLIHLPRRPARNTRSQIIQRPRLTDVVVETVGAPVAAAVSTALASAVAPGTSVFRVQEAVAKKLSPSAPRDR